MGERGGGRDNLPARGRQVSTTLYFPGVASCELWTFRYRAAARFLSSVLTLFRNILGGGLPG